MTRVEPHHFFLEMTTNVLILFHISFGYGQRSKTVVEQYRNRVSSKIFRRRCRQAACKSAKPQGITDKLTERSYTYVVGFDPRVLPHR
jgi:hypothetical protein